MKEKYNKKICTYNKLVRDNIPEIIENTNKTTKIYICDEREYYQRLKKKLLEEVQEFIEDDTIEELADILEVIYALAKHKSMSPKDLDAIRAKKAQERGAFDKKIVLLEVRIRE